MPELPEVEVMRRKIETHSLNKVLQSITVHDGRIEKGMPAHWQSFFVKNNLIETRRIGKYLFLRFHDYWLHLHFGMTGSVVFTTNRDEIPQYTRLTLHFDNDIHLNFTDPRTFGKIDMVSSVDSFANGKKLGKDLMEATESDAIKLFSNKKISLKAILLKQNIISGVGNWLADEALFRAKLHPATPGMALTESQMVAFLSTIQSVAEEAIAADTHYGNFPSHFFTNYRVEDKPCPSDESAKIQKMTLGGRATYFCPKCQKFPG
ncbi:MAG: Fpg/Nei family DNA glycosylase [Cryomorphaceae bacterium]|nr:Fpg/Nei family DNA glycosylase [Cryomorphaceae bacterium]